MSLVPNISANSYCLSAIILGYVLNQEITPAEQNSLGNWFMLVGQVLCTNSSQQQVINNRANSSNNLNSHIIDSNEYEKYYNEANIIKNSIINFINKK